MCALFLLVVLLPILSPATALPMSFARPSTRSASSRTVLLEHPTREKILAHLEVVPGDHFRSIVRSVKVSVGETRHHLNILMRRGLVREQRGSRVCRYYSARTRQSDRTTVFEAFWRLTDCRHQVLTVVQERNVVRPSEVAIALGISRQLADYHLQHLAATGEIHREQGSYYP